jgi:hypothetical protein
MTGNPFDFTGRNALVTGCGSAEGLSALESQQLEFAGKASALAGSEGGASRTTIVTTKQT